MANENKYSSAHLLIRALLLLALHAAHDFRYTPNRFIFFLFVLGCCDDGFVKTLVPLIHRRHHFYLSSHLFLSHSFQMAQNYQISAAHIYILKFSFTITIISGQKSRQCTSHIHTHKLRAIQDTTSD